MNGTDQISSIFKTVVMKNVYLYVNLFKTGAFVVTRDRPGAAREGLGVTLPPRVSE